MSVESPPSVICDTYNYKNWNVDTGTAVTKTWVLYNFLSKRVADICQGVISFVSGIKTNAITLYSGTILTIGEGGGGTKTVSLYYPYLAVAILDAADDTGRVPSTSWVQLWFGTIVNTISLSWALAQTFTLGILTNSINCITTSGILNINSVEMGTGGVIICGGPTQTSGVTIGNTNGITTNKIDIGSQTKTLSLTGSTIDLITPFRPFYSYPIAVDRIGEVKTGTLALSPPIQNFITTIAQVYSTITLTREGIYQFFFQSAFVAVDNTTSATNVRYFIVSSSVKYGQTTTNFGSLSTAFEYTNSCSSTVYHTGTQTYQAIVQIYFINTAPQTTPNNFVFTATRIA